MIAALLADKQKTMNEAKQKRQTFMTKQDERIKELERESTALKTQISHDSQNDKKNSKNVPPAAPRKGSGRLASQVARHNILRILEYERDADVTRRSAYYDLPDTTDPTPLQMAYSIFNNANPTLVERKQFRRLFVENILTTHDFLEFEEAMDINADNPNYIEEVPMDSAYWALSHFMSFAEVVRIKTLNSYVEFGTWPIKADSYVPLAYLLQDTRYTLSNPKPPKPLAHSSPSTMKTSEITPEFRFENTAQEKEYIEKVMQSVNKIGAARYKPIKDVPSKSNEDANIARSSNNMTNNEKPKDHYNPHRLQMTMNPGPVIHVNPQRMNSTEIINNDSHVMVQPRPQIPETPIVNRHVQFQDHAGSHLNDTQTTAGHTPGSSPPIRAEPQPFRHPNHGVDTVYNDNHTNPANAQGVQACHIYHDHGHNEQNSGRPLPNLGNQYHNTGQTSMYHNQLNTIIIIIRVIMCIKPELTPTMDMVNKVLPIRVGIITTLSITQIMLIIMEATRTKISISIIPVTTLLITTHKNLIMDVAMVIVRTINRLVVLCLHLILLIILTIMRHQLLGKHYILFTINHQLLMMLSIDPICQ